MLLTLLDLDGVHGAWIWDTQNMACLASAFSNSSTQRTPVAIEATSRRVSSLFAGSQGAGDEIVTRFSEGLLLARREAGRMLITLAGPTVSLPALRVAAGICLRESADGAGNPRSVSTTSIPLPPATAPKPQPAAKPAPKTRLGIWD